MHYATVAEIYGKGEFHCQQLEEGLRRLSMKQRSEFYTLTDAFSPSPLKKTKFGIVKTNSFSVTKRNNRALLVLLPRIARINHSCVPNCHHYWSNKQGNFFVRAVERIERNQEICISYMSPLQRTDFHATSSRQAILRSEFGFDCLCDICGVASYAEDVKRRRILDIETAWSDLGGKPEVALQMGEEQFELCKGSHFQAGLLAYVALHCVEAASLMIARAANLGTETSEYRTKAFAYAKSAAEYGKVAYGDKSEEYEIFRNVVDVSDKSDDQSLLRDVQTAITRLRDIDS